MIERFITYIECERRYSPLTVRNYRHDIESFAAWWCDYCGRESFTPSDVTVEELRERISEYERKLDIIQKTKAYLGEAKDILTSKYLSKTKSAFDKYVKLIGNESGDDFSMNTSFAVMKEEHGSLKESDAYSRGMRDLYALATRLALIDSLYENELPFIILDDPFAYFDDEKLACAVKALKAIAKEKQILYLTCTKARSI